MEIAHHVHAGETGEDDEQNTKEEESDQDASPAGIEALHGGSSDCYANRPGQVQTENVQTENAQTENVQAEKGA
jgi:hypothetical protein